MSAPETGPFREQVQTYGAEILRFIEGCGLPPRLFYEPDHLVVRTPNNGGFFQFNKTQIFPQSEEAYLFTTGPEFVVHALLRRPLEMADAGCISWVKVLETPEDERLEAAVVDHAQFLVDDIGDAAVALIRESKAPVKPMPFTIEEDDDRRFITLATLQRKPLKLTPRSLKDINDKKKRLPGVQKIDLTVY